MNTIVNSSTGALKQTPGCLERFFHHWCLLLVGRAERAASRLPKKGGGGFGCPGLVQGLAVISGFQIFQGFILQLNRSSR